MNASLLCRHSYLAEPFPGSCRLSGEAVQSRRGGVAWSRENHSFGPAGKPSADDYCSKPLHKWAQPWEMGGLAPREAVMDTFPTWDNRDAELSPSGQVNSAQWTVWAGLTDAPDICGFTLYFYFIYLITIMGRRQSCLTVLESHRRQYSFPSMSAMFATFPTFILFFSVASAR